MNKREELIEKYATDLKTKCNINPEMDLLTKVTICGLSIYNKVFHPCQISKNFNFLKAIRK